MDWLLFRGWCFFKCVSMPHILQDFTWKGEFDVGVKLFVLLEACNGASMCSSAHSDGIIIDKTPPVPGLVTIGRSTHDSFIPDKYVVLTFALLIHYMFRFIHETMKFYLHFRPHYFHGFFIMTSLK